jgi:Amiloride-sensitive sodium channel
MGKLRVGKILLQAKALFTDYSKHSTIHGVKYIAEKDRSWFEKILWIAIFCLSLSFCGKLISDAGHIHPIIISFAEKPTPVWQVILVSHGRFELVLIALVFSTDSISICERVPQHLGSKG